VSHGISTSIHGVLLILCLIPATSRGDSPRPVSAPGAVTTAPVIVIGFVGGFVSRDDMVHGPVQLAAQLRKDCPPGVHVEVLENRRREAARAEIMRLVDVDRDGALSPEEKKNARIILYGHSWGASEAVTLARELGKEDIPVLLTVQVDSVPKPGENDRDIPANVAEAANFYEQDGWLHGRPQIRAADPSRTHIIGNFRTDYKANPIRCDQYPWWDRFFTKAHTEMECDPKVWSQVESLIQSRLPQQRQP
jgi:hypothetical protein